MFKKYYSFSIEPIKAGQRSDILVNFYDYKLQYDKLLKIELFEDVKKVCESRKNYLYISLKHTTPEKHKYFVKFLFEKNEPMISDEIIVQYTGTQIDFPPFFYNFMAYTKNAGMRVKISASVSDIGDNKGIKELSIYEDNKKVDKVSNYNFIVASITHKEQCKHRYYAEVIDNGNHKVRSKQVTVRFTGKPYPPKITRFSIYPSTETNYSLFIVCDVNDEQNFPDGTGIKKIILYENNKKIKVKKDTKYFYEKKALKKYGVYEYYIEVINEYGLISRSEKKKVDFADERIRIRS